MGTAAPAGFSPSAGCPHASDVPGDVDSGGDDGAAGPGGDVTAGAGADDAFERHALAKSATATSPTPTTERPTAMRGVYRCYQ
jgi:hypothetical protein